MARPFEVRQAHPIAIVLAIVGVAGTVGALAVLGFVQHFFAGFVAIFVGFAALAEARRAYDASLRLRVDEGGVTMPAPVGRARGRLTRIPWSSVRELVLTTSGTTPMTLAVRLADGAPLPRSVKGRISDPDDPDAEDEQLTARIGDLGLDGAELLAALAAFGGGRPVVERAIERFAIGGA